MVRIYLIRHAEAEGNVREFFQGRINTEVSEKGHLQLDRLAERFRDIHIEAIYSSPLKRARSTAEAVNRYHGLPIITDNELMEIDGGDWEGIKWAELPIKFPEELRLWKEEINHFTAPHGESSKQVCDRMKTSMRRIAADNRGRTIAAVSHGMAIKAYLNFAAGREWESYADPGWADNTAVSLIEYNDELIPKIVFKNDASHLEEGLSTLAVSKWCSDELEAVK